jgi:hypothetical protein
VKPRRIVIGFAVLFALLGSAGCGAHGTSSSKSCQIFVCRITVTGEQEVELTFGDRTRFLRVGPIEPGVVTLAMGSDHARLAAGDSAALDGLAVLVTAVGGQDVQLVVRSL